MAPFTIAARDGDSRGVVITATHSNCSAELRELHVPGRLRLLLLQGDRRGIYQLRQGKESPAINRRAPLPSRKGRNRVIIGSSRAPDILRVPASRR